MQPLREFGAPLLDLSGTSTHLAEQSALDPFWQDGRLYYWKSNYFGRLDDVVVARAAERPSPRTLLAIRHLVGATSRVGEEETAYGNRGAQYMLSIDSTWESPRDSERNIAWTREFWAQMREHSSGVYVNFAGLGEEGQDLMRSAHRANYERLTAAKREYDPVNLFRTRLSVTPAAR